MSTWEEGSLELFEDYSVSIDPSCAIVRNPFSEKKWKNFQFSSLFGSSNSATKVEVIDLNLCIKGTIAVDRWLVVLSLGSGQTRNMALDRYVKISFGLDNLNLILFRVKYKKPLVVCKSQAILSSFKNTQKTLLWFFRMWKMDGNCYIDRII